MKVLFNKDETMLVALSSVGSVVSGAEEPQQKENIQ